MKRFALVFAFCLSSHLFAETWYGFCTAEKDDVRYCTLPELRNDALSRKCLSFAQDMGAYRSGVRYSTDREALEASLGEYCDQVQGDPAGAIYSCQVASMCAGSSENIRQLASKVYANNKAKAVERCFNSNETKIKLEVKKQSAMDCFTRVAVEVIE